MLIGYFVNVNSYMFLINFLDFTFKIKNFKYLNIQILKDNTKLLIVNFD